MINSASPINSLLIVGLLCCSAAYGQTLQYESQDKQRIIALTDITNEPDDQESLVRFLVYANEFDVEGIIATTSVHLRDKVRPDKIEESIHAYGQVKDKLDQHASGFPSASYLLSVTKSHLPLYGMKGVGKGKDSQGSDLIISAVDKIDARPLWISVWGGANCLAQALWKIKNTRTNDAVKKFISKIRVYAISDQDDSGRWIRNNFPDVFYIVSPSSESWFEYYKATWTGISGDAHYKNGPMYQFEMVSNPWLRENIINNHGPLGELYPPFAYIMEGDTPSFIGLINNGLGSAITPAYGGWSGRYDYFKSYTEVSEIWTNSMKSRDEVTLDDGKTYCSDQATIWRWREAFQNDFAARMDWCVASDYKQANHNPVVAINNNVSKDVVKTKADEGHRLKLSAKGSSDPDGHKVSYRWFLYKEAGGYSGNITLPTTDLEQIEFKVPQIKSGESIHIICEVKDDGTPALFSYRRIIVSN